MGNYVEVNDALQITEEQGFPVDMFNLNSHRKNPVTLPDVEDTNSEDVPNSV